MTGALILAGGPGHPAEEATPALVDLLGGDATVTDVATGLEVLDPELHDLLVVSALAFRMEDARYDAPTREAHAFHLDERGRSAIDAWVSGGRPVLAVHTAVICFDDWPRWGDILGGAWDWERSWHPPIGPVEVISHQAGIGTFSVVDERYSDLRMSEDVTVLAEADGQPVCWRRVEGSARIACSTLGHDRRSLDAPAHRRMLLQLVAWLREDRCRT